MMTKGSAYRSKVDLWMVAAKVVVLGIVLFATYHMLRLLPPTADIATGLMLPILVAAGFSAIPLRYLITSAGLVVQSGVLKTRIAAGEILRLYPSSTLAAREAMSLDQVAVEYRAGPHSRLTVHISPERRDEFLRELAAVAGLEPHDQQWIRPAAPSSRDLLNEQTRF